MAPYFASAFGTFLMRQTFRQIPRDFEEAATIDGAQWWQTAAGTCCCRWPSPA